MRYLPIASHAQRLKRRVAGAKVVVIMQGRNVETFLPLGLLSLAQQEYGDWHALYLDDDSSDKSVRVAQRMIQNFGLERHVSIIKWPRRRHGLENLVWTFNNVATHPDHIIAFLDADDWLANPRALNKMVEAHRKYDVVWSQQGSTAGDIFIRNRRLPRNVQPRDYKFVTFHFRSFKRYLFTPIDVEYMLKNKEGKFYRVSRDMAVFMPILELAGGKRWQYIPDVLYCYNALNPSNTFKSRNEQQKKNDAEIRDKRRYAPLTRAERTALLRGESILPTWLDQSLDKE